MSHDHTPHANSEPLISLEQVNHYFGDRHVLQNISFSLNSGSITTLIGPNGAGKTTLVKVVLGLLKAKEGSVSRKKGLKIGYMPQKLNIDQTFPLTVERFLKTAKSVSNSDLTDALKSVKSESLLKQSIHHLSGGEMQRVLLARALLQKPDLLVLDEPVQGVDINGQIELYRLIANIRDSHGCGVFMISHDLHLVMASTDEVICMNRHICCSGHPEAVQTDPSFTALFGEQNSQQLAVYSHHHNHQHTAHGDIVEGCNHD